MILLSLLQDAAIQTVRQEIEAMKEAVADDEASVSQVSLLWCCDELRQSQRIESVNVEKETCETRFEENEKHLMKVDLPPVVSSY
eukprot:767926-Hanusia_phi.AAC.4